ncbi:hypothetical protein [Aquimarina sp. 2201CG14-23]|uniref:hypothetical protein n=1 Tax=Aquimarina mycalae TaxID=3040073 RepID=UPI002477DDB0|nr:hypothetical protein [Aquimarina sp. 2201CG14-23]MDH7446793.1 hypothetical protein [Aquimarina sp. 2201CG14-23]
MKHYALFFILSFPIIIIAQKNYGISPEFPYGQANPEAPEQIKDFESMIGICDCKSVVRKKDQSWADPINMTWTFKYIMNGMAIQDETIKEDGGHSGSIRQFIADSSKWYVHYYSSKGPTTSLPVWEGNKKDDKIVLYKEQKAPNGMEGNYRLTFYDMSNTGYKWIGEWVDTSEKIIYPTWKIACVRKK